MEWKALQAALCACLPMTGQVTGSRPSSDNAKDDARVVRKIMMAHLQLNDTYLRELVPYGSSSGDGSNGSKVWQIKYVYDEQVGYYSLRPEFGNL
jgi:hypothetical protein